jgi:MinD superfamily P-loop ATPase
MRRRDIASGDIRPVGKRPRIRFRPLSGAGLNEKGPNSPEGKQGMTGEMKEIVVISGKGGTGKTSLCASFAVLARSPVVADCDVDAADLHLILAPRVEERHEFRCGNTAVIRQEDCIGCGECLDICRYGAVEQRRGCDPPCYIIDPVTCEGCGVCVRFCPAQAIEFPENKCGEWMVSETRCGPMVHARLAPAAENSGKLVSTVRREARRLAEERNRLQVIVDGPPGIGCPVIASVTGASQVVVVTEPTVSGEHDLKRVLELARQFGIPAAVCLNKWDLNPEASERIENEAARMGARPAGRIRYDRGVTLAQMREKAVVETDTPAAEDIRRIWNAINQNGGM